MALNIEEQEQLAGMRYFWQRFRWVVITVVLITVVGVGAYYGWRWQQQQNSLAAAALYGDFEKLLEPLATSSNPTIDIVKAKKIAADLQNRYGNTAFARMAAFTLAAEAYKQNDKVTAEAQWKFVIEVSPNDEYQAMARLNLMSFYIGEGRYDESLKLADGNYLDSFAGFIEDRRGDTYLAQKKYSEARMAYEKALPLLADYPNIKELVEVKIATMPRQ